MAASVSKIASLSWPVQWHEGMLIGPQHFQHEALVAHHQRRRMLEWLSPFFWGIQTLVIDVLSLSSNTLRITALEGILPDGTVIALPENMALELSLDPFKRQAQEQGPLLVYLVLPQWTLEGMNASAQHGPDAPRFVSALTPGCVDFNTGEHPLDLPRLAPNLSLHIPSPEQDQKRPHPRYVSMPVAQVTLDDETFQLTSYIPPHLHVTPQSVLSIVVTDILGRLKGKIQFLIERLMSAQGRRLYKEEDFLLHSQIRAMGQMVPYLDQLLQGGVTHPYKLYEALLQLAGHVCALRPSALPPQFPVYDHDQLYQSFERVIAYIARSLDFVQETHRSIPFAQTDRIFALRLASEWIKPVYSVTLTGNHLFGPPQLAAWIENAIIASETVLKSVREKRILGAARRLKPVGTSDMGHISSQTVLIEIDHDPQFIRAGEVLCIVNLSDHAGRRPQEITLNVEVSHVSDGS